LASCREGSTLQPVCSQMSASERAGEERTADQLEEQPAFQETMTVPANAVSQEVASPDREWASVRSQEMSEGEEGGVQDEDEDSRTPKSESELLLGHDDHNSTEGLLTFVMQEPAMEATEPTLEAEEPELEVEESALEVGGSIEVRGHAAAHAAERDGAGSLAAAGAEALFEFGSALSTVSSGPPRRCSRLHDPRLRRWLCWVRQRAAQSRRKHSRRLRRKPCEDSGRFGMNATFAGNDAPGLHGSQGAEDDQREQDLPDKTGVSTASPSSDREAESELDCIADRRCEAVDALALSANSLSGPSSASPVEEKTVSRTASGAPLQQHGLPPVWGRNGSALATRMWHTRTRDPHEEPISSDDDDTIRAKLEPLVMPELGFVLAVTRTHKDDGSDVETATVASASSSSSVPDASRSASPSSINIFWQRRERSPEAPARVARLIPLIRGSFSHAAKFPQHSHFHKGRWPGKPPVRDPRAASGLVHVSLPRYPFRSQHLGPMSTTLPPLYRGRGPRPPLPLRPSLPGRPPRPVAGGPVRQAYHNRPAGGFQRPNPRPSWPPDVMARAAALEKSRDLAAAAVASQSANRPLAPMSSQHRPLVHQASHDMRAPGQLAGLPQHMGRAAQAAATVPATSPPFLSRPLAPPRCARLQYTSGTAHRQGLTVPLLGTQRQQQQQRHNQQLQQNHSFHHRHQQQPHRPLTQTHHHQQKSYGQARSPLIPAVGHVASASGAIPRAAEVQNPAHQSVVAHSLKRQPAHVFQQESPNKQRRKVILRTNHVQDSVPEPDRRQATVGACPTSGRGTMQSGHSSHGSAGSGGARGFGDSRPASSTDGGKGSWTGKRGNGHSRNKSTSKRY